MSTIHIANTNFEIELEGCSTNTLKDLLTKSKFAIQLQYLPFLYKDKFEEILVCGKAEGFLNDCIDIEDNKPLEGYEINSWGYSQLIEHFASKKSLKYEIPDFNIVKKVNSKIFSFENSDKLPGSFLVDNAALLPEQGVLKSAYGFSAKGHCILHKSDPLLSSAFLKQELSKGFKVIYEPWVERILDFSTQWSISASKEISYIGATIMKNSLFGAYLGSVLGEEKKLFGRYLSHLEHHKLACLDLLKKIRDLNYFGFVGIDSMIYKHDSKELLKPIVEVNARKTLGYCLLKFWEQNYPSEILFAQFTTPQEAKRPLLPSSTELHGKKIIFDRQLTFELISPFL
jgi:hypothetical protein